MKVIHRVTVPWPPSKELTKFRKSGQFKEQTIANAAHRVFIEVASFTKSGQKERTCKLTICANQKELNQDKTFRGGLTNWNAPQVVVTFDLDGVDYTIPCDAFTSAAQNLCAIAETIKGLRANERYGVLTMKQMMEGVSALPQVSSAERTPWFEVLGVDRLCSLEEATSAYRKLATVRHPNAGGKDQEWYELQEAWETAKQVCK